MVKLADMIEVDEAAKETARQARCQRIRKQIELLRQQMHKAGNDLEYESLLHRVRDYERLLKRR